MKQNSQPQFNEHLSTVVEQIVWNCEITFDLSNLHYSSFNFQLSGMGGTQNWRTETNSNAIYTLK